jgi:hypothetical protein
MATLYELTENMLKLQQLFDDEEIDEQTFQNTMECLQMDIEEKADGYARVIRNMESVAAAIEAEQKRLRTRKEKIEKRIEAMKENLKYSLQILGIKKIQTDLFTVSIALNPPKVVIDDESKIPKDYIYMEPKIDRTAIKTALQSGIEVPACRLERGESLRIK